MMLKRPTATRRRVLTAAASLPLVTLPRWPANAAEFTYKLGGSSPMEHPAMARSKEAADRIRQLTNGRLDIQMYPSSQLGGDTSMISQTISGAMQMYILPIDLLASRNPICGIPGVGFAFPDYDHVWAAIDGDLGRLLRATAAEIGFHCLEKTFDHGFRDITTRTKPIATPDDLVGFKVRIPVAPYLLSLFRHLGASPVSMNFSEVYSALQTGVMDGQENPLVLIDTAKLYEVQKYCSLTNHVWSGFHLSFNMAAWKKLPPDVQEIVDHEFTASMLAERQDFVKMTADEQTILTGHGMTFNKPDIAPFRATLSKSGFYPDIRKTSGEKAWTLLEKYVGPLG
jgi:tripartite ATP-independent transporter DctP family solute receptor